MVDDLASLLLPSSRRGWGWLTVVLGTMLAVLVWFAGPTMAAAAGTAGGAAGLVLGVLALLDRRRGGWWALAGVLLIGVGIAGFATLRIVP